MQSPKSIFSSLLTASSLIQATFSGPRQKNQATKIYIKPILIKGELLYQAQEFRGAQVFHTNYRAAQLLQLCEQYFTLYKQVLVFTKEQDIHILFDKQLKPTILNKPSSKKAPNLSHNMQKKYLLPEDHPVDFLIELDVMNTQGRVYPHKRDKFRQINRFLEMIDDLKEHFLQKEKIQIIDFGCGKAYLTFALYYYFAQYLKKRVAILGLDLKKDVVDFCQTIAQKLQYKGLNFVAGDIESLQFEGPVDMVVSLHACDVATDAALYKAVKWQAEVILSVPCCQHELYSQVANETLQPLLKHGILKERFASLVTDAARAQVLEVLSYKTQLLEFIDLEHTPKNLLIRAVKRKEKDFNLLKRAYQEYKVFKESLIITPAAERLLQLLEDPQVLS